MLALLEHADDNIFMKIIPTDFLDVKIIIPQVFRDDRGMFSETYKKPFLESAGISIDFIQDNRSESKKVFTVRGLHYQMPPFAQTKLVAVQQGRIFDVAVDLRRSSPTFSKHIGVELTAEGGEQLLVPAGFAHGFCTLEPDTIVSYKVDNIYSPTHERILHWQTPALGIPWPCKAGEAFLSAKDAAAVARIDPPACFE
jgi:dTDP-4-dehydrorhamnose 3,5-epimerase